MSSIQSGADANMIPTNRILLTHYFFTSGRGRHFDLITFLYFRKGQHLDLSPLAVQWVTD